MAPAKADALSARRSHSRNSDGSANECRTDPLGNRKEGPDFWAAQAFEQGSAVGSVFPRPA
jgi:hypothetical protein